MCWAGHWNDLFSPAVSDGWKGGNTPIFTRLWPQSVCWTLVCFSTLLHMHRIDPEYRRTDIFWLGLFLTSLQAYDIVYDRRITVGFGARSSWVWLPFLVLMSQVGGCSRPWCPLRSFYLLGLTASVGTHWLQMTVCAFLWNTIFSKVEKGTLFPGFWQTRRGRKLPLWE